MAPGSLKWIRYGQWSQRAEKNMDSAESRQRHRGYPGKSNDEENRRGAEKWENTDKSWNTWRQSFLAERRISEAKLQQQRSWLRRAHQNRSPISIVKDRCRITHEIRDGETGEVKETLKSGLESSMPVMCCRFNPIRKEIFYATSACGTIFMCDAHTKEFSRLIFEPRNELNTIDVSITAEIIWFLALILMYKKEDLVESKAINFHRMRIFASRFHEEYPDLFITGGWDNTVRIWDIRIPIGSIRVIKGPYICGDAIDMHETYILTGSWVVRDSLQVWDLMSAKLIETINPQDRVSTLNGEFLYAVQYFDGDPYGDLVLAGGSGTGIVEVISLREEKVCDQPFAILDSDYCKSGTMKSNHI